MDAEREPDYRMSLAAERTYLAYIRTGLALLAGGVAVAGALPNAGAHALRRAIGVVLVLTGGALIVAARWRWQRVTRAMRRGEPMPVPSAAHLLGWVLSGCAVAVLVLVLVI